MLICILPYPLGGSWVVISGVRSKVTILITPIGGLITPLITTHEPPSRFSGLKIQHAGLGYTTLQKL